MNTYQKILSTGLLIGALAGINGCTNQSSNNSNKEPINAPVVIAKPYIDGRFTTQQSGTGVAIGDINGDGLNDLVVGDPTSVKYFRNVGNGRFIEEQLVCSPYTDGRFTTQKSGIGVALGDIDGDKKLDLIVATPTDVKVYLNKNGHFEPQLNQ